MENKTNNSGELPKVMVVDDSRLLRVGARRILSDSYHIIEAGDGDEAWRLLCDNPEIEVVCCDLNMPVLDGYGFLQRVRTSNDPNINNLPVIILTGDEDTGANREEALNKGATDFISKSFDSATFKTLVGTYISSKEKKIIGPKERMTADLLTGLGSRAFFERFGQLMVSHTRRHQRELIVMQLVIDDFQEIFSQIGKDGVNMLLKNVGEILAANIHKEDALSRIKINGFSALFGSSDMDEVIRLANLICSEIAKSRIEYAGQTFGATVSLGLARVEVSGRATVSDLIKSSDRYLADAQRAGGNQVAYEQAADTMIFNPSIGFDQAPLLLERGRREAAIHHLVS